MSFAAYYYPQPASGLFLSAGVGFSTVGAGYDLRVGANLSITPAANFVYGHPADGFSHNFFQFGPSVTFH